MYIFLYPDGTMDVKDEWLIEWNPPVGTLVYEPSDSIIPWTIQRSNGPEGLNNKELPPECKAVELLYPRETVMHKTSAKFFMQRNFKG